MNDIIEGRRKSGWFWKGIYISEKDSFRDNNGKSIEPDINRIVPLAIYIPSNYSPKDSRLAFILHGGTGNENATYITVEEGNHTYNWGSILDIIFDFFESNLESEDKPTSKISSVTLNGKEINGTTMIELGDFEKTFGDRFKVYKVYSYDKKIENAVEYYTIISKNQTLNFKVGDRKYRKNIERYKEDIGKRDKDIELLDNASTFSQAPTLIDGKVYIPVKEILEVMR